MLLFCKVRAYFVKRQKIHRIFSASQHAPPENSDLRGQAKSLSLSARFPWSHGTTLIVGRYQPHGPTTPETTGKLYFMTPRWCEKTRKKLAFSTPRLYRRKKIGKKRTHVRILPYLCKNKQKVTRYGKTSVVA